MGFFEIHFIPDILRQLKHINFQMRPDTRVSIHIKCFSQILIITVMHEYILLKLATSNLYENLQNTFQVFTPGAGE
jgi:hypothetical protein